MEFSALASQTLFRGKTTGSVAKCRLFTQTTIKVVQVLTVEDTRAALLSLLCDKILINLHIWGEFDKTSTSVVTVLESENNSYTCKLRL